MVSPGGVVGRPPHQEAKVDDLAQSRHEIRVHGIGDKDDLSSLGPAELRHSVADGRASVLTPPPVPSHHLSLVNWSRWNRTGWRVGWILSWPFTVLNAAAQMKPPGGRGPLVHAVPVHLCSLLATVVSLVWIAASIEIVARSFSMGDAVDRIAGPLAVGAAALLLVGVIVIRSLRANPPSMMVAGAHSVAVILAGIALGVVRPSQVPVVIDNPLFKGLAADSYTTADFARIPEVYGSQGAEGVVRMTQYVDPLACVAYGSLGIAGVVLVVVTLAAEKAPSTQCAAIACVVSIAVVNLYGSVLLAASKTVVAPLTGVSIVRRFVETSPRLDDVGLVGRTGSSISTHVIPLVMVLALLIVLLSITVMAARLPLPAILRSPDRRESLNREAHKALPVMGKHLLTAMCVAATGILLTIEFVGLGVAVAADRWGGYEVVNGVETFAPGRPATLLLTSAGLVLTGLLFALRNGSMRARLARSLAFVGDVIGFWPVQSHPFAAQSYRPAATEAIAKSLAHLPSDRTVLVGHSQGSVLAAWHLAHDVPTNDDENYVALITCGSPLMSLYGQFFPAHFGDQFFSDVREHSRYWVNVWRTTDPIATTVSCADENPQSTDPMPGKDARCHSHYWTDEDQAACVNRVLGLAGDGPVRRGKERTEPTPS